MKASFKQRLLAYLVDLIIIGLLIGIVTTIKEKDEKVLQLRSELHIVEELYVSEDIKFSEYFDRITSINQQIEQECVIYKITNIIAILIYFILLPFFWGGQTLGKRLMKIKVVSIKDEKVSIVSYFIRNTISNGLGYILLVVAFLYLLPAKMYFVCTSILSFIQIILVIISAFMILYRRDKRGLHDILSGTKVILVS